jgi:uncharacterized protein YlxP (DUF503 family)
MVVGSLRVRLLVRESRSLKDKRQVVRSILDRLRHHYNVSAAEVELLDDVKSLVVGVAAVGPEAQAVRGVLDQIAESLRRHPIAEFVSCEVDV